MSAVDKHREVRVVPPKCQPHLRPMGSAMISEHAWREICRRLKLSVRELEIVRRTFDDQTDVAIAQEIGISLSTVHTHVERLHQKLAIADRPQLLLRIMQEFLTLAVSPETGIRPNGASHDYPFRP